MRLIECYIENFGKLSKKKISFAEGLNCIIEDNGSGKTTLAAFIKVMLYGMSDTKRASLEENDRKHYLPWQGGACGGSLTFSAGGKTYRVERSFGAKAADDTYVLYDTATGRACTDFPEGLGEGLFGIDADGFERTVFLSERALTPKSENKSISAKLSDLVGCDGDIGGMDDALERLEEKRKFYYKRGGAGEIADTRARLDEVTRRLASLEDVEKQAQDSLRKMGEIATKRNEARERAKELTRLREDAVRRAAEANYEKQYKEIKLSLEETVRKRTAVAEIFGTDIPTHPEIDEASYKSTEARRLVEDTTESPEAIEWKKLAARFDGRVEKSKIDAARDAVSGIKRLRERESDPSLIRARRLFAKRVPTEGELDRMGLLLSEKKRKTSVGFIVSYIIFALIVVLGVVVEQLLIAAGVVGILATLICELVIKGRKNKQRSGEIDEFFLSVCGVRVDSESEAKARLEDMRALLPVMDNPEAIVDEESLIAKIKELVMLFPENTGGDIITAAESIIAEYDRYASMAVAQRYIQGDRTARIEKAERLRAEANAFLARFRVTGDDPFGQLRRVLTEYDRLTAEIVAKQSEMERLESLHTMGEGGQRRAELELAELDRKRHENDELIANLDRDYALTERIYNSQIEELDSREELMIRRGELEEQVTLHTERYNTILLTKKYLTEAKDNMTSRYLGKTKAGFIRYAEKISGITGDSFEMDTDFGITKQDGGVSRTVEAYSRGTRDLFNLAARLGLVDSLYEKERPFIILDDPFTAFDDGKTAAALKLLCELAKERQIIYFTCAKSRGIKA